MYVPHERRALILRLLEQRGYLRSAELAHELGVTEETIRTDIIALQQRRLLLRVHGGARFIPPAGGAEDATRLDCQLLERLLPHLKPGMQLYVDACPLGQALLARMGAELPCRILTPSPRLLLALAPKAMPQQGLIPGGELDKSSNLISAEHAAAFFRQHKPEIALLFPPALVAPDCLAYHQATRAAWAAAASRAAQKTLVAAPAHAFYTSAEHRAHCRIDHLISEDNLPAAFEALSTDLIPYLSPADLRADAAMDRAAL